MDIDLGMKIGFDYRQTVGVDTNGIEILQTLQSIILRKQKACPNLDIFNIFIPYDASIDMRGIAFKYELFDKNKIGYLPPEGIESIGEIYEMFIDQRYYFISVQYRGELRPNGLAMTLDKIKNDIDRLNSIPDILVSYVDSMKQGYIGSLKIIFECTSAVPDFRNTLES